MRKVDRINTESSNIEINKLRPKKVKEEKEQLYEEALKLKIQTNGYKDQNKLLKTQLKIVERKLAEKEEIVNELFNQKDISTIGSLGLKLNK